MWALATEASPLDDPSTTSDLGEGEGVRFETDYLTGTEAAVWLIDTSLSTCRSAARTLSHFWIRSRGLGRQTAGGVEPKGLN